MDSSSAEVVTARTAGVLVLESLIRSRTRPVLRIAGGTGVVLIVVAIVAGGLLGIAVGLLGLGVLAGTGALVAVRRASLAALRHFGGGPMFELARPVVAQRLTDIRAAGSALPIGRTGLFKLLRHVRRRSELQAQIREAGEAMIRQVPELVGEVRLLIAGRAA